MTLSWQQKRQQIVTLIKELSALAGGDDQEFLKSYAKDILQDWNHDLEQVIQCFNRLVEQQKRFNKIKWT